MHVFQSSGVNRWTREFHAWTSPIDAARTKLAISSSCKPVLLRRAPERLALRPGVINERLAAPLIRARPIMVAPAHIEARMGDHVAPLALRHPIRNMIANQATRAP